jgi:cell division septation protein DedD
MSSTHDDAFREIQLSGKQLVFFCMAAVVIAVVIFLLGVQVGRGVLAQRGLPDGVSAASVEADPPPPPASASQGAAPITAGEKLSYAERLSSSEPTPEKLRKPEDERSAAAPARREGGSEPSGPPPRPSTSAKATADRAAATADQAGYEIQVAALRLRGEADSIVARLATKGYPAYVVAPAKGTPTMFRVRVGKYKDRHEADTVAAKLQKEEQFKPWVVR